MFKVREAKTSDPTYSRDCQWIIQAQIAMALETEELKLDPETVSQGVQALYAHPNRGSYWLVEKVTGADPSSSPQIVACLLWIPEWSDWRNGTVYWIHSLYVLPEYRRQGLFQLLYDHLKNWVSQQSSLKGIRLYVDQRNQRACRAYEKVGMNRDHYYLYEWLKS